MLPYSQKYLFDEAIGKHEVRLVVELLIALLVIFAVQAVATLVKDYLRAAPAQRS